MPENPAPAGKIASLKPPQSARLQVSGGNNNSNNSENNNSNIVIGNTASVKPASASPAAAALVSRLPTASADIAHSQRAG